MIAQKIRRNKLLNKQCDSVSCNIAATSAPWKVANLLGLWMEMICQYAIWPNLVKFSQVAECESGDW
jgi:hypothetical protein